MYAAGLVEVLRIGRELVPEAVEVDPLAALHEPFHVRAAEAEVPEQRVLQNLVPGADAGDRRVHQDQMADPARILGDEGVGDHVADIVGDHVDLADVQGVQHA